MSAPGAVEAEPGGRDDTPVPVQVPPAPQPRRARGFWIAAGVVSAVWVVGFMAVLLSWSWRAPPGLESSGVFQGDMPTYLCYARMAAASPTLLTYAHPHDFREPPRPVYLNLPITFMGGLLAVLGSPALVENGMRLVFGVGMFLMLALLLERLFGRGRWFWAGLVLIGLGGGISWALGLITVPPGGDFFEHVRELEEDHYWWALSLLRNLMYPLELLYHIVLLGQLLALVQRRWWGANALFLLGVLCNPFLGVQMLGLQLGMALMGRGQTLAQRGAAFAIAALFLGYYGVLLPLDPVAATFQQQHRDAFTDPLSLRDLVVGHGLALLGVLSLAQPSFRRWLFQQPFALPLLGFTAWTFLLTQSSRIPFFPALQPMHFTRGYLALGLWCLTLLWLRHRVERSPRARRFAVPGLVLLALSSLPDNALFLRDRWHTRPPSPILMWPTSTPEALEFLSREPGVRRVFTLDADLSRQICAWTTHRTLYGTKFTTPRFDERYLAGLLFRKHADVATSVGGIPIDTVIVPIGDEEWLTRLDRNPAWRRAYTNALMVIYFRRV